VLLLSVPVLLVPELLVDGVEVWAPALLLVEGVCSEVELVEPATLPVLELGAVELVEPELGAVELVEPLD